MTIYIEDLKFQCIIGILDFERQTPQDIIINLNIDYDYVDIFINYAEVVQHIKSQMIEKKFLLIEDALISLIKTLTNNFNLIQNLTLKVTKPTILADCLVSVATSYKSQS